MNLLPIKINTHINKLQIFLYNINLFYKCRISEIMTKNMFHKFLITWAKS